MHSRAYIATLFFTASLIGSIAFADHAVNINTAGIAELDTLPGIGEARAEDIVDHRTANGPFATIEDIMDVSGIGTGTYNNIKDHITVGTVSSTSDTATTTSTTATTTTTATSTSTSSTSSGSPAESSGGGSYVPPPVPLLFAEAGDDRIVMVGADTEFRGYAYNRDREVLEGLVRFNWNFGDGTTAEGEALLHHFEYPGTYAVVLTIAQNRLATSDRIRVTAEPAQLGFWTNEDGSVSIQNLSGRDLNLSGWLVRSFDRTFALPADTYVLRDATLRLTQKTMRFPATSAESELLYPNGVVAFRAGDGGDPAPAPATFTAAPQLVAAPIARTPAPRTPKPAQEPPEPAPGHSEAPGDAEAPAAVSLNLAAAASLSKDSPWTIGGGYWWLGAFTLALVAASAMVAVRRAQRDEWDIIEES